MLASRISPGLSNSLRSGASRSIRSSARASSSTSKPGVHVYPIDPAATPSTSQHTPANLLKLWGSALTGPKPPAAGTTRLLYGNNGTTALASLGNKFAQTTGNSRRERIRSAVGGAVQAICAQEVEGVDVFVDSSLDPHASGSSYSLFSRTHL